MIPRGILAVLLSVYFFGCGRQANTGPLTPKIEMGKTALREFERRGGFSRSVCGQLTVRRGDWDFEINAAALVNSGLSDFPLLNGDRFEWSESAVPCMTNDQVTQANIALREYLSNSSDPNRKKLVGEMAESHDYIIRVAPLFRFPPK